MNSSIKKTIFLLLFAFGILLLCYQKSYAVVTLIYFTATPGDGKVSLDWETATEFDNAGFYISRSTIENGEFSRISDFIPSEGIGVTGAVYQYLDTKVINGNTYYYILESVNVDQTIVTYGPISATPVSQNTTPTSSPSLTPTETSTVSKSVTCTPINLTTSTATPNLSDTKTQTVTPSTSSTYTKSPTLTPTKKPSSTLTYAKTKINTPTVTPTNTSIIIPSPTLVPLPSIVISYLPTRTILDNHIKETIPEEQDLENNNDTENSQDNNNIKRIIVVLIIILWIIISIGLFLVIKRQID